MGLLRRGVPVHVVARILGHSDPALTLRFYARWLPDDLRVAAEAVSASLFGSHDIGKLA